jgi:hypothetical protein
MNAVGRLGNAMIIEQHVCSTFECQRHRPEDGFRKHWRFPRLVVCCIGSIARFVRGFFYERGKGAIITNNQCKVYSSSPDVLRNSDTLDQSYLCWKYPIKTGDNKLSLPTCPYVWPNGQGDVGKFLEGIVNSEIWEKQHGQIYRLWSGMNPEV